MRNKIWKQSEGIWLLLGLVLLGVISVGAQSKTSEEAEVDTLHRQAVQLFNSRNYAEALPIAKRVVELRTKAFGAEHETVVVSLKNLAAIYTQLEKYNDTSVIYQKILAIEEKQFGASDPRLGDTLSKLGWARAKDNNENSAESIFKRNIQIQEKTAGGTNEKLLPALFDLAQLYQRIGRHDQAVKIYQRIITLYESGASPQPKQLARYLVKYAVSLRYLGKKENITEAEKLEARALTIYTSLNSSGKISQISGGVLTGRAIIRAHPVYPDSAKSQRIQGAVQVGVTINEAGIVIEARSLEGALELRKASEDAARKWRFEPVELDGSPIMVQGVLTFNFTLQ